MRSAALPTTFDVNGASSYAPGLDVPEELDRRGVGDARREHVVELGEDERREDQRLVAFEDSACGRVIGLRAIERRESSPLAKALQRGIPVGDRLTGLDAIPDRAASRMASLPSSSPHRACASLLKNSAANAPL
jgi:hypothetical protein